jgi:thymidylate synthase
MNINKLYKDLGIKLLYYGKKKKGRNGNTLSLFGESFTYDCNKNGFPILSMRKINYRAAFGEFVSFLKDAKTVKEFEENECPYWKLWADKDGNLTLDYPPREQLDYVINLLKNEPNIRRIIIDLWNPKSRGKLSLDPCHTQYQFYVRDEYIDMIWTQRSVDYAIGAPYDFILAACYLYMLGKECNYTPGKIRFNFGDVHLYEEHIEKFTEMMKRNADAPPIDAVCYLGREGFNIDSIKILNYNPQPYINFILKE